MKKIFSLIVVVCLLAFLPSCGNTGKNGRPSIICTTFPQYDWTLQVLGDQAKNYDLTLLADGKMDLHNFQPSTDDIVKISQCDLFIYVGGESEKWVTDALKNSANEKRQIINLLETLGTSAKIEELPEGAECDDNGDALTDYDEHVWLSLQNAQTFCIKIADVISEMDRENAKEYRNNSIKYVSQLKELDGNYQEVVSNSSNKIMLFADRFPFKYLADDYGIKTYAAFSGCSAETEASFETIIFLTDKINELGLKFVMVTETSDQSIAKRIISSTNAKNQEICVLNSMQSTNNNKSYITIMEENLEVLRKALE